jgi:two-component system sensor histidine kinase HydH
MSDVPAAYAPFEGLPLAVLIVAGPRVAHANPAAVALLHRSLHELQSIPADQLIAASVDRADVGSMEMQLEAVRRGQGLDRYWVRIPRADGSTLTLHIRAAAGPGEGERTLLLLEAGPDEAGFPRLTEALTAASWGLVRLRDEQQVLAAAADALEGQGMRVVLLRLRGEFFEHSELRQDSEAVREAARRAGAPISELHIPRSLGVEFDQALTQRRAVFVQDTHPMVDRFRPPHVAEVIKAAMPRAAVLAPIFIDEQPFGVLSVNDDALTPAAVGTIALFAQRVGAALENVRHHQRAQERLNELNELQHKLVLQERVATLGEAAAVLAHEVRNPVGAILNAVAVLKRSTEPRPEVLQMVEEEALRLDRLVRDLLHLARPLQPKAVPLELGRVVARAIATVDARTEDGVAARVRTPQGSPVRALGDAFLLALALENLIVNALRAAGPHGRVEISLRRSGDRAVVAVDDDGPGIAAEVSARLFEPFFTTHATGTGLGLAVVRRVAEAHLDKVRVGAGPLGGARFELELPAAD